MSTLREKTEIITTDSNIHYISDMPFSSAWNKGLVHEFVSPSKSWKVRFNTTTEGENEILPDWPERLHPSTQTDILDDQNFLNHLLFQIKIDLPIPYLDKLVKRLYTLIQDAKEEDPDSCGINTGSLESFFAFFKRYPTLKYPSITLTPDNNIYTSWRGEGGRVFSIHFLPSLNVRFVIFRPNDKHPGRMILFSGEATIDCLFGEALLKEKIDWI